MAARVVEDELGCVISVFDFRDYNIRVWNGDVFINSYNTFNCVAGRNGFGMQTNSDNEYINDDIKIACKNIANEFIKLNNLINKTIK